MKIGFDYPQGVEADSKKAGSIEALEFIAEKDVDRDQLACLVRCIANDGTIIVCVPGERPRSIELSNCRTHP